VARPSHRHVVMMTTKVLGIACLLLLAACMPPKKNADASETAPEPTETPSGGETSEPGARPVTYQNLSVDWSIQKADGTPDTCPPNYGKIKVSLAASNESGIAQNGDLITTIVDCEAKTATLKLPTSGHVPEVRDAEGNVSRHEMTDITGKYVVTLQITEATGEVAWQTMLSKDVELRGSDKHLAFVVTPSASQMRAQWRLGAKAAGTALSCAAAGVDKVRVTTKRFELPDQTPDPAPPPEVVETWPCDNDPAHANCSNCVGSAVTKPLAFGYYKQKLEALSASGEVVGATPYLEGNSPTVVARDTIVYVNSGGNPARSDVWIQSEESYSIEITNR
jgi:hypothetical protein